MDSKQIIQKYVSIIAVVFLIFLVGRIYYDTAHKQMMIDDQTQKYYKSIDAIFQNSEELLIKNYTLLTQHFMNSHLVAQYLKNNDREKLYELLQQDYNDFKTIDPNLFVMHFFDPNNKTILRMHKPSSFGDDLTQKRPIVAYANKALKQQNAFEVGKNGIVYRVSSPFFYQNEHIGLLEFGIKLDYFTKILENKFELETAQLVKTDQLDVLIAKKQYPQIKDFSVVAKENVFNSILPQIDLSKHTQYIYEEHKTYMLFILDMEDFNGNVVAKFLALKDITNLVSKHSHWFYMVNISSVLVYLLVIALMVFVLSKFASEIKNNLSTIKKLNKHSKFLHTQANTDFLTKVYNKRYFDNYLSHFKHNHHGALIIFDIDHFKNINDTYGHLVGDKILQNLAKHIQNQLRENDILARWGGEEFVILLENSTLDHAHLKAEHLRISVQDTALYDDLKITISMGISQIDHNISNDEIIKEADKNLYIAKQNGRNQVVV